MTPFVSFHTNIFLLCFGNIRDYTCTQCEEVPRTIDHADSNQSFCVVSDDHDDDRA